VPLIPDLMADLIVPRAHESHRERRLITVAIRVLVTGQQLSEPRKLCSSEGYAKLLEERKEGREKERNRGKRNAEAMIKPNCIQ
jgi:hypothetical protein